MKRDKDWQKFEDLIAEILKEIDPFCRATKGSGNNTESGDLKNSVNLQIECKDYNKKSVYKEEWMQKVIEEVPLHIKRLPVLFTRNNEGKIRVHLDGLDFLKLYIEYYKGLNK